jgi:polyhydroxybutyrate depolymerase
VEPGDADRIPALGVGGGSALSITRRCAAIVAATLAVGGPAARAQTVSRILSIGGLERHYRLHIPPHLPRDGTAALILVFHGRGGDGAGMERLTGFSALADRDEFAVAYPDGIGRSWNDGRVIAGSAAQRRSINDLGFVTALMDTLTVELRLDPRRIFATGLSNGAAFSHYLAANLARRIAAIASVAGGLPAPFARQFAPEAPVSVLVIQGTADPVVPYAGGAVAGGRLGSELGAKATALRWEDADGIRAEAAAGELPDTDPTDGCRARWQRWSGGRKRTEVWLYTLVGGGHTWPGGPQYLPQRLVGRVCRDFDATFAIWDFFSRHGKAAEGDK